MKQKILIAAMMVLALTACKKHEDAMAPSGDAMAPAAPAGDAMAPAAPAGDAMAPAEPAK